MRSVLLGGLAVLLCAATPAPGQTYEVSCPGGLNQYFYNYQPVPYAGYDWFSQWMAQSPDRPLPSLSWYRAYPDRDIVSTDGKGFWSRAEIRVHCWVYRSMYLTVVHYDPVDFGGDVRAIPMDPSGGCGGGETMTDVSPTGPWGTPLATAETSERYDPYDPGCSPPGEGGGGGGESGGGMSFAEQCSVLNGTLYYDYVCLEQWNPATETYETVWCGTAAICET